MKLGEPALGACAASLLLVASPARGITSFVTDDASVVGDKVAQLETWLLVDRLVLEHNTLAAIGPSDWLELTVGFRHGGVHSGADRGYSIAGPVAQVKALLVSARNYSWPGLAIAAGVLPPVGYGAFAPPGWGGSTYLALTESLLDEALLLHANVGVAAGDEGASSSSSRIRTLVTAGLGFQVRIDSGLQGAARNLHGDPYDPRTALQAGFCYIFNEWMQLDSTFGSTLTTVEGAGGRAQTEQWGTLGLALVTPELW